MSDLTDLPFTDTALARAIDYGHGAEHYEGIDPAGANGKYLVAQVEEVEAERAARSAADFEPINAGAWNGLQNWGCPYCPFQSLRKDRVRQHTFRAHNRAR